MFTRVLELNAKSGKGRELAKTIQDKVLPILREQSGFVDEIVLVSDNASDRILAQSFWKNQSDAERYNREQYPKVNDLVRSLLENPPKVQTYNVDSSTAHKVTAGKAAA